MCAAILRAALLLRVFVVLPACVGLVGCNIEDGDFSEGSRGPERSVTVLPVNVLEVTLVDELYQEAIYYGSLRAPRTSTLAFGSGGAVSQILKEPGDQIVAGEILANLAQPQLEQQKGALEDRLLATRQELAGLANLPRTAETSRRERELPAEIQALEQQLRDLEARLLLGAISAPYDGRVASRTIDVGDMVAAGQPVVTVFDDGPAEVDVHAAPQVADRVETGQQAWIYGVEEQPVEAVVAAVSPIIDRQSGTQSITLRRSEDNASISWTPGYPVETRFGSTSKVTGCWLPRSALQREIGGLWSAFFAVDKAGEQVVERRTMEVLQLSRDHALVAGPMTSGDLVLVNGIHRIAPGQRVIATVQASDFQPPGPPRQTSDGS